MILGIVQSLRLLYKLRKEYPEEWAEARRYGALHMEAQRQLHAEADTHIEERIEALRHEQE
jgi:hypothetical protein